MSVLHAVRVALAALCLGAPSGAAGAGPRPYTGTYDNYRQGVGCELRVAPRPHHRVRFQLDCTGRGPAHNSGSAAGVVRVVRGVGVFRSVTESGSCAIRLRFRRGRVGIRETERGWGCALFGAGVVPGGTLHRVSARRPHFDPDAG